MKKKISVSLLVVSLGLMSTVAAFAGTKTGNLHVSGNVIPFCKINSIDAVTFPDWEGAAVSSTGSIKVQCSKDLPYNVALDTGQNLSSDIWRQIVNGENKLKYGLYKPGGVGEWGDNDFGGTYSYGSSVAGNGTGAEQALTVNATLWGSLNSMVPAGIYTDVVTVTVHY
jgi:spore coat protein U-like protein